MISMAISIDQEKRANNKMNFQFIYVARSYSITETFDLKL